MQTIGVLGGSFNPVHVGHVMLASYLSQYTSLDEVWLMLSPCNPLKNNDAFVADEHRLNMLKIAVESVKGVDVCDIELTLPRPSYTIKTLDTLKERYPDKQFRLVIGSDNWLIFDKWKDYQRIIADYGVIVYPRPGYEIGEIDTLGVGFVNAPVINLSSTFIRDGFFAGKDMSAFLPNGVDEYIRKNNLFQNK